jgi:hypothetical protein
MEASYQVIAPYQFVVAWLSMRVIPFGADAEVAYLRVDRGRGKNVQSGSKSHPSRYHLAPQDDKRFASRLDKSHPRTNRFLDFLNARHLINRKLRATFEL